MTPTTRRKLIRGAVIAGVLILLIGAGLWRLGAAGQHISLRIYPPQATDARLTEIEGKATYQIKKTDGKWATMAPDTFAQAVWAHHQQRSFGQRLMLRTLNVSSSATIGWVLLGLIGQILFAGRMIVQWVASEKKKQSVIPHAFWWMALGGASLLLIYFVWRKDIIGILGQSTGWCIYTRNLYFIYRPPPEVSPAPPEVAAAPPDVVAARLEDPSSQENAGAEPSSGAPAHPDTSAAPSDT